MKINLTKFISWLFIITILFLFIVMTSSQLYVEYSNFQSTSEDRRVEYVEQQKQLLKSEVLRVLHTIEYERMRTDDRLKADIKSKVNQAYDIIHSIWTKYKNSRTRAEIISLIKESLGPVRFSTGRGYYFIMDLNGNEILNPAFPKYEGTNLLQSDDAQIRKAVAKTLDYFSNSELTDGYFESEWQKPTAKDDKKYIVFSYEKLFKPYNWLIGTSEYLDEVKLTIQDELLNQIAGYRFGKEGYIFINRYDGRALVSNGIRIKSNKKLWEEFGEEARSVFDKEIIAARKKDGDFIYYTWRKLNSDNQAPKVSFIYGIPEWQWLIGAGVYIDDVEREIQEEEDILFAKFQNDLLRNVLILILILGIFLVIQNVLVRNIRKEFQRFFSFFKQAAQENELIPIEKIRFEEFRLLAEKANSILQDKLAATQDLFNEKEYLAVTLNSISDGVIASDTKHKITSVNKAAQSIIGTESPEIYHKELVEIFPFLKDKLQKNSNSDVLNQHQDKSINNKTERNVFTCADGKELTIEYALAPLRNSENERIGEVVVIRDISDKIRADEEILKVKKLESVGVLAGGIAHDFNNLLAGIFGNISLAKIHMEPDAKAYRFIESSEKSIDRATALTKQLLTFAKGGEPVKDYVDMPSILKELTEFNLRGSNVKAEYYFQPKLWATQIDKGQFSQVITNLVINARQAMPEGGTINIKIENHQKYSSPNPDLTEGQVKISIQDHGCGIPKKYLNKVFDPYFTTKQQGSGLGLAMVYSIIQKHQGHIEVESEQDIGTIFTIYIPAEEHSSAKLDANPDANQNVGLKKLSGRALLMDDEEIVRQTGTEILKSFGLNVESCADGGCAVEMYKSTNHKKKPFDLVILDLTIPGGMGGEEALKEILDFNPEAKVLVSSGYSTDPILANYKKYGFSGRIEKPYLIEQMHRVIQEILQS